MKTKKLALIFLAFNLLFLLPGFAGGRKQGEMPAPRLLLPHDAVSLSGKSGVEFTWGNEGGGDFDHYDFTVYKGSQPYEPYILVTKKLPKGTYSTTVESSYFQPGQTYNWSLRYGGSKRSMKSYSVFKIDS